MWHHQWDAWDRLRTVVTPDGQTYRYTYDPSGRRLTKTSDRESVLFAWHGTRLVEQTTIAGEVPPGRICPASSPREPKLTALQALRRCAPVSCPWTTPASTAPQADVDRWSVDPGGPQFAEAMNA